MKSYWYDIIRWTYDIIPLNQWYHIYYIWFHMLYQVYDIICWPMISDVDIWYMSSYNLSNLYDIIWRHIWFHRWYNVSTYDIIVEIWYPIHMMWHMKSYIWTWNHIYDFIYCIIIGRIMMPVISYVKLGYHMSTYDIRVIGPRYQGSSSTARCQVTSWQYIMILLQLGTVQLAASSDSDRRAVLETREAWLSPSHGRSRRLLTPAAASQSWHNSASASCPLRNFGGFLRNFNHYAENYAKQ